MKTVAEIGETRISRLMDMSVESLRNGDIDRSRRYVELARRVGMKTRGRIPKERMYCKDCLAPLVPGIDCTVRLSGHKVVTTCGLCGTVRRLPYLREQRR
jgi:ribonuclease P protein subunit RPR2